MTKRTELWTRPMALAVSVVLLAGGHLTEVPAPAVFAAAPPCGVTWRDVPGANLWPFAPRFNGLAATGPNDVWLVGELGVGRIYPATLVEHWDGREWRLVPSPTPNQSGTLTAVAALSPNNAWAVGTSLNWNHPAGAGAVQSETLIMHWDGNGWHLVPSPNDTGDDIRDSLSGIAATGPTDIWAVGGVAHWGKQTGEARILHWDGTRWSVVPTGDVGANAMLNGVVALRPDDAWAVGSSSGMGAETPLILHWDGHSWSKRLDAGDHGYLLSVAAVRPDDAWAVGTNMQSSNSLQRQGIIRHWDGHTWQAVTNPMAAPVNELFAVAATAPDDAWAVGDFEDMNDALQPALLHWDGRRWTMLPPPPPDPPTPLFAALVAIGPDNVWAAGYSISHYADPCTAPPPPIRPYDPVPDPHDPAITYFPPVQHTLRGLFRAYWQAHGGLAQFGYPRTEEFQETSSADGRTYTVQYFERNRFEYHPEYAGTPNEVLLGLLGRIVTAGRTADAPFQPAAPGPGRWFPETQHTLAPEFLTYWQAHGGLALYGYPLSEPFQEVNPTDGKTYLVQYFERNRFELHPENVGTPYDVLLGLLGNTLLQQKGWQ